MVVDTRQRTRLSRDVEIVGLLGETLEGAQGRETAALLDYSGGIRDSGRKNRCGCCASSGCVAPPLRHHRPAATFRYPAERLPGHEP
jgi:hypothetical protein